MAVSCLSRNSALDRNDLKRGEVAVWQISLREKRGLVQLLLSSVSMDELERANRFACEVHRNRFLIARAATRHIVGRYTGVSAREVIFSCGPHGKPEVCANLNRAGIRFNVSHSHELAVVAVTRGHPVGIDIELVKPEVEALQIAERFFSSTEFAALRNLPEKQRVDAFFSCWTRKEAYLKALGGGLSIPLDSFEVAFGLNVPAAVIGDKLRPADISRWKMYDINVPRAYKAALVVEGRKMYTLRYSLWLWRNFMPS